MPYMRCCQGCIRQRHFGLFFLRVFAHPFGNMLNECLTIFGSFCIADAGNAAEIPHGARLKLGHLVQADIVEHDICRNVVFLGQFAAQGFQACQQRINPDWNDFEQFLEERCFPKSRAFRKTILKKIGADGYDTLQILEKTDGRTAEDNQYVRKGKSNIT